MSGNGIPPVTGASSSNPAATASSSATRPRGIQRILHALHISRAPDQRRSQVQAPHNVPPAGPTAPPIQRVDAPVQPAGQGPVRHPDLDRLLQTERRPASDPPAWHTAVKNGDVATVERMLANGADPNIKDPDTGKTALQVAAEARFVKMVQALAAHPSTRDPGGHAFNFVIDYADRFDPDMNGELVRQLYISCADVSRRTAVPGHDVRDWLDAARFNEPQEIERLLRAGGDPNVKDPATGKTALHVAAESGSLAAARMLAKSLRTQDSRDAGQRRAFDIAADYCQRVDPHRVDPQARAFYLCFKGVRDRQMEAQDAVKDGDPDMLASLLDSGVDPNFRDPVTGKTALHLVAESGSLPMAQALVRDLRTVDSRDRNGQRAVDLANAYAVLMDPHRTNPLMGQFVNCFQTIRDRNTEPLDAVRENNAPLLKAILEDGRDPNIPDPATGKTALHLVAESGSFEMAKVLLADLRTRDVRDKNHQRAFEAASAKAAQLDPLGTNPQVREFFNCFKTIRDRHIEPQDAVKERDIGMLQSYLDAGGDPNFRDPATGKTALHLVAEAKDFNMARLLAMDPRTRDLPDRNGQRAWDIANAYAVTVDPAGTNPFIRQFHREFTIIRDRPPAR